MIVMFRSHSKSMDEIIDFLRFQYKQRRPPLRYGLRCLKLKTCEINNIILLICFGIGILQHLTANYIIEHMNNTGFIPID